MEVSNFARIMIAGTGSGCGTTFDSKAYKEQQYDLLADALRASLDMKFIYKVIEKGI